VVTVTDRPTPLSIDRLLEQERAFLRRLTPGQAADAARAEGALLVDIRYAALRERDGLEWRLDPLGDHRLPEATGHELTVVVICNEGYASSLAARSLQALGLHRATDLVGGFQAWAAAGLPVTPPVSPAGPVSGRTRSPGSP
jgi:rhodanese-related sulfurtransferase